mmetsp:Transcript_116795/g.337436  ORF Transcript_116795/g.337436 Transcript_116795/m.337436 type:complete len:234 (+) Transcript_116795:466-1167(+)
MHRTLREQRDACHGPRVAPGVLQANHLDDPAGFELGGDVGIYVGLGEEQALLQHAVLACGQPTAAVAARAALIALRRADECADDAPLRLAVAAADSDHVRREQIPTLDEDLVVGGDPRDPADDPGVRGDPHAKARKLSVVFVVADFQHKHLVAGGEVAQLLALQGLADADRRRKQQLVPSLQGERCFLEPAPKDACWTPVIHLQRHPADLVDAGRAPRQNQPDGPVRLLHEVH